MELLLTHGYFLYEDPKELQIMKPYPPLGLLYICSHLRAKGFSVEVFDSTFQTFAALRERLHTGPPSVLGIYANLMTRPKIVSILGDAKQAGWKTIVGGPEPGAYIEEYLDAGADVVVIGEGELTLQELLTTWRDNREAELDAVSGIAFRKDGVTHRTASRTQITDLDAQPWPAREAIDMDRYVETWRTHHGKGSISIITARGCPFRCEWCSHAVFGQTHRRRKPELVADELEWLIERYKPDMLWIADDVFTINHDWLTRWAAELRRRRIHIPFECISRSDRLNEKVIAILAELGCFRLWVGSESGSQKILDSMQRGVSVQAVRQAVTLCRQYGIQTGMFLMWGYEGEELEDIEATIDHVRSSNPDIFLTTVSYPIKGTPYYNKVASRLIQIKPWDQTSDREFELTGRRPREFYRIADELLRYEVELAKLRATKEETTLDTIAAPRIAELTALVGERRRSLYTYPSTGDTGVCA
ncbi:B12-binding domain-containing radical SAM protein [Paracidobacterium acidisoli]|uniref:Radical SAM protein n=1 Tax=Paracidobacterium acidisoli TaxID=2303751 RepID=A0A372IME9_9BACT|nr:radical SAM protein [Paracidobacterium acidisoli]MBT9332354.1 B12-binding domain-containing radical SAM protein [Paracidobacterium acidisoli]